MTLRQQINRWMLCFGALPLLITSADSMYAQEGPRARRGRLVSSYDQDEEMYNAWVGGRGIYNRGMGNQELDYYPGSVGLFGEDVGALAVALYITHYKKSENGDEAQHQDEGGPRWLRARMWIYKTAASGEYDGREEISKPNQGIPAGWFKGEIEKEHGRGQGRNSRETITLVCDAAPQYKIHLTGIHLQGRGPNGVVKRNLICRITWPRRAGAPCPEEMDQTIPPDQGNAPKTGDCDYPPEETILEEEPIVEEPTTDPTEDPAYYEEPVEEPITEPAP